MDGEQQRCPSEHAAAYGTLHRRIRSMHSGGQPNSIFACLLVAYNASSRRRPVSRPTRTGPSVQAVNLTFVRISPVGGVLSFLGRSYVIV